nr:LPXTG cell wall anchor domain-containing protein [Actinomycetota bacterium]
AVRHIDAADPTGTPTVSVLAARAEGVEVDLPANGVVLVELGPAAPALGGAAGAPTPAGSSPGKLPATGRSTSVVALVALVAGVGLSAARRRKGHLRAGHDADLLAVHAIRSPIRLR